MVRPQQRVAVAELAGQVDVGRDAREALEHRAADQSRVPGRAAGDDLYAAKPPHPGLVELDSVEVDVAVLFEHARADRVADCPRLLVDLLLHEAVIAALLGLDRIPLDAQRVTLHACAVAAEDRRALRVEQGDLAVLERHDHAAVREDRGDVGGDEVLALSEPKDARASTLLGRDDAPRLALVDDGDRARTLEPRDGSAHRVEQRHATPALGVDQAGDDLGVGVGAELEALRPEFGSQRAVVLDDAVVDQRDRADPVRVRVLLGRLAVGGPARVAHAGGAVDGNVAKSRLQVHELADGAHHAQLPVLEHRDAGRVVAAVLEPAQSVEHDVLRPLLGSHVADDPAHARLSSSPL